MFTNLSNLNIKFDMFKYETHWVNDFSSQKMSHDYATLNFEFNVRYYNMNNIFI
jgi:hypothetical protein